MRFYIYNAFHIHEYSRKFSRCHRFTVSMLIVFFFHQAIYSVCFCLHFKSHQQVRFYDFLCLANICLHLCIIATVYSMHLLLKHQVRCIEDGWQLCHASSEVCLVEDFSRIPHKHLSSSLAGFFPQSRCACYHSCSSAALYLPGFSSFIPTVYICSCLCQPYWYFSLQLPLFPVREPKWSMKPKEWTHIWVYRIKRHRTNVRFSLENCSLSQTISSNSCHCIKNKINHQLDSICGTLFLHQQVYILVQDLLQHLQLCESKATMNLLHREYTIDVL